MKGPPSVLPAFDDVVDSYAAERLAQVPFTLLTRISGELDSLHAIHLFEPFGVELEHERPRLLDGVAGHGDRDAPESQRK